jgi:hypothetical protein
MFYPAWDNATSYPVNSIVSFNGLLYIATFYHDPASTVAPNVETGLHPVYPALFGLQRSWTLYSTLPTGYTASPFSLSYRVLISPVEENDRYFRFNEVPGIYNEGISREELTGTFTNVNSPCPLDKCVVSIDHVSGPIYGTSFSYAYTLFNPVLAPSGTYYQNGPDNAPGGTNTLYIWWRTSSPSVFQRSVTIYAETGIDPSGNPVITQTTFVPSDNTYNNGAGAMLFWYAPGNQDAIFTSGEIGMPVFIEAAYDVAPND